MDSVVKIFNHTAHKELWIWLSENPKKQKSDWIGWDYNGGKYTLVKSHCFACRYAGGSENCSNCPLVWGEDKFGEDSCMYGGLWDQWDDSVDDDERSELALQIANLPVKEGVTTI